MGLEKPQLVGQVEIRGMAVFPNGHKFEDKMLLTVGKGSRSAIITVNDSKVYWFVLWNGWGEGQLYHPNIIAFSHSLIPLLQFAFITCM
jgi:hypothetical protein